MEELAYETNEKSIKDWIEVFKRRKNEFLSLFLILLLISILAAVFIPSVYRSTATILIQQQEIPQDMVRSTITSYADQRLYQISQKVMTSINLWEIVEKYNLYESLRKREPREVVIEEMRDDINFEVISADVIDPRSGRPTKASIAFKTSYDSRSPNLAFKVANDLTTLYLNENIEGRTQLAEDARTFLSQELKKLDEEIGELEAQLATFKEENVNRLPEMVQLNFQMMDRSERELVEVNRQILSLKERRIYLNSELSQVNPHAVLYSDTGERIMSPADRLKALQTEMIRLKSVYASSHPDIVRLEKEIRALEAEVGGTDISALYEELEVAKTELAKVKERYSSDHPDVKRAERIIVSIEATIREKESSPTPRKSSTEASNPAYVQLASQVEAANAELNSLYSMQGELRKKIEKYEQDIALSPSIEKEYRALNRDYETANLRYQEIKVKLSHAELGESLEEGRKGERFELIEPALQPEKPVFPNRPLILLLGFILSSAAAFGFVAMRENLDDSVRSTSDIMDLVGMRPLAVVPTMITSVEHQQLKAKRMQLALGIGSLILICAFLIHMFYKPLDVMWFVGLRKLGIS